MESSAGQNCLYTLEDAMKAVGRQTLRIMQLEAENASLHTRLYASRNDSAETGGEEASRNVASNGASICSDHSVIMRQVLKDLESLPQEHEELKAKYDSLVDKHSRCESTIAKANRKVKEAKTRCREWKDYVDRKVNSGAVNSRHKPRETVQPWSNSSPAKSRGIELGCSPMHVETSRRSSPQAKPCLHAPVSAGSEKSMPQPDLPSISLPDPTQSQQITSSQTTITGPDENTSDTIDVFSDNEGDPVLVSARSLKRKRGRESNKSPVRLVNIKIEPSSSTLPTALKSMDGEERQETSCHLRRTDTTDLDASGPGMTIPHTHGSLEDSHERVDSKYTSQARHQLTRDVSRSKSQASADNYHENLNEVCETSIAVKKELSPTRSQLDQPGTKDCVLQSVSTNIPATARGKLRRIQNQPKCKRTTKKNKVGLISEAGDENSQVIAGDQSFDFKNEPNLMGLGHLADLLDKPPPAEMPKFLRDPRNVTTKKQSDNTSSLLATSISNTRQTVAQTRCDTDTEPSSTGTKPGRPELPSVSPHRLAPERSAMRHKLPRPSARPEVEPLRVRGLSRLSLDDFKINPKYLGTNFAFSDTLRGREQRKDLHACTRPDCCGGPLQKALAMEGVSLSGKTDGEALEAFLGPTWTEQIGACEPAQRKDLIGRAHGYCFANQHGKHHEAFERHSTPPGFWDTDFPTTQETAENRAKAAGMERQAVAERWREAMRPGGQWIFRDE